MSLATTEIEFKYSAEKIALCDFKALCDKHGVARIIEPAGFDYFYKNPKEPGSFCRHRKGALTNQLTFKQKTTDKNNFVRTEHNIDLARETAEHQIEAFLAEFGYKSKSAIYKNAFVYLYEGYNFVYYVVFNSDMNQLGRFIEIEMDEHWPWKDENEAYSKLVELEQFFKPLGITPQSRIRKSLFEMFG